MTDAVDTIATQRAAFLASGGGRVCLGNAAGDLDSVVSALAAAALYGGAALARFPREDLALRRDAEAALAHDDAAAAAAGGAPARLALVFGDEAAAAPAAACEVVLTDHNAFDGGDASLAFASPATVVAVVDHHADEGRHADARDREIDAACGSCCTMLAERLLARGGEPPARLLALAFAAVAVDCRGFAAKHAGLKFSPRDVALGHAVLDALGGGPAPDGSAPALRGRALPAACAVLGAATVGDLAKRLLAARKDVSALDAPQLLRLDYKRASAGRLRVGAASIMAPLSDFSRRAGGGAPLGAALRAFAAKSGVDVLFAMTAAEQGAKGLAYVVRDGAVDAAALERRLEAAPEGLPGDLLALPLFATQRVTTDGFGLAFGALLGDGDGAPRCSRLRADITRKTVLPFVLHVLGELAA